MAAYQFTIYTFCTVGDGPIQMVGGGTDLIATPGSTRGFQAIGETFAYTGGAGTTVTVEDDDAFANDGNGDPCGPSGGPGGGGNATDGNQILANAATNPPDWRGQFLQIEYTITVRVNGGPDDGQLVDMDVVRIGPNNNPAPPLGNLGIVSSVPLDPTASYTVVAVTEQQNPPKLRTYVLTCADSARMPVVRWDTLLCFTFGTLIETPDGPQLIEELAVGDLVTTLDNGSQPLRWLGTRRVGRAEMLAHPYLRPIRFETGALGNTRPLLVSTRHRMLLNDWRAEVYFGEDQVLIAAEALVNGRTIRPVLPDRPITYCHLLFDRHEVILADGALLESFHPGEAGMGSLDAVQRQEIAALFPHLPVERRRAAFPIVKRAEARALALPG